MITKEDFQREFTRGAKCELDQVVSWLRGPQVGSDTIAWQESVGEIYKEIADQLIKGKHWNG